MTLDIGCSPFPILLFLLFAILCILWGLVVVVVLLWTFLFSLICKYYTYTTSVVWLFTKIEEENCRLKFSVMSLDYQIAPLFRILCLSTYTFLKRGINFLSNGI